MMPSDPDFGPRAPIHPKPQPASVALAPPVDETNWLHGLKPTAENPALPPSRNAGPPQPSSGSLLLQRICTHNPLYAISAAFMVYGLWASFPAGDTLGYAPKLAVSLGAYVVLLTATAIVLQRLGTLWEDLRMLGLLVVLLLPMVSITLDATLLADPRTGRLSSLVGGALAVVIGETLLFGLRVRLPLGYRVPYHLLMTLFFVYPLLVTSNVAGQAVDPHDASLQWRLFGFAQAGAAILLSCLYAILRGPGYVSQNGTPWRWPLYPMTVFAFLTLCVVGRADYLCRSFHPIGEGQSIFGSYFLVPLVFVISVLTLAAGKRNQNFDTLTTALLMPVLGLMLASVEPWRDPFHREFLDRFREATSAYPPLVALWCATGFYALAAVLRIRGAFGMTIATLVASAFVGPDATSVFQLHARLPWPLGAAAAMTLTRGLWRRDGFESLAGAGCTAGFVMLLGRRFAEFPAIFAGYHALVLILLLAGWRLGSERGRGLRIAAAVAILAAFILWERPNPLPLFQHALWARLYWYPTTLFVLTSGLAVVFRDRVFRVIALAMAALAGAKYGLLGYAWLKRRIVGLDAIAVGMAFLAGGIAVSLTKARQVRKSRDAPAP